MKGKKSEEYRESQITTMDIFGFTFYIKKLNFARKHSLKRSRLCHHILFVVFMRCRIFEKQ